MSANLTEILHRSAPVAADVLRQYAEDGTYTGDSDIELMNHAFWINDLLFAVPPEQIISQSEDSIWSWQSLRTNSTAKTHSGKGNQVYTIRFSIPHRSAIINFDGRMEATGSINGNNTGKRGGLVDLILQFKNIPIARVENAVLRSDLRLGPDKNIAMCMHQLTYNTVVGEPNTIECTLILSVFNYSPFSPNWAYKEDWRTKPLYGNQSFEDVNFIRLRNRDRYKEASQILNSVYESTGVTSPLEQTESSLDGMNMSVMGERQRDRVVSPEFLANPSNPVSPHTIHVDATEFQNGLWPSERRYMAQPQAILNPAYSSVFKAYVDWIWSKHQAKVDRSGDAPLDCTKLNPYGSGEYSPGDQLRISYRQYQDFEPENDLVGKIRTFVRRRVQDLATGMRSIRDRNATAGPIVTRDQVTGLSIGVDGQDAIRVPAVSDGMSYLMPGGNDLETEEFFISRAASGGVTAGPGDQRVNRFHNGWDLYLPPQTPIYMPETGELEHSSRVYANQNNDDDGETLRVVLGRFKLSIMHIRPTDAAIEAARNSTTVEKGTLIGVSYQYPRFRNAVNNQRIDHSNPSTWTDASPSHTHIEVDNGSTLGRDPRVFLDLRSVFNPEVPSGYDSSNNPASNHISWDPRSVVPANQFMGNTEPLTTREAVIAAQSVGGVGVLPPGNGAVADGQPVETNREVRSTIESAITSVPEYREFVLRMEDEGWTHYKEDLTVFFTFYKEIELNIPTSSYGDSSSPYPIQCIHLGCSMSNMFRTIPMSGSPYPTAQYLGKTDDNFSLTFNMIGLNNMKMLSSVREELRSQAAQYKHIPDACVLRIENELVNCTGYRYFMINGLDFQTIEQSPNMYGAEMRLVSTEINREAPRLNYVGISSNEEIRKTWLTELLEADLFENYVEDTGPYRGKTLVRVSEEKLDTLELSGAMLAQFREALRDICKVYNLMSVSLLSELPTTPRQIYQGSALSTIDARHNNYEQYEWAQYPSSDVTLINRSGILPGQDIVDTFNTGLSVGYGPEIVRTDIANYTGHFLYRPMFYREPRSFDDNEQWSNVLWPYGPLESNPVSNPDWQIEVSGANLADEPAANNRQRLLNIAEGQLRWREETGNIGVPYLLVPNAYYAYYNNYIEVQRIESRNIRISNDQHRAEDLRSGVYYVNQQEIQNRLGTPALGPPFSPTMEVETGLFNSRRAALGMLDFNPSIPESASDEEALRETPLLRDIYIYQLEKYILDNHFEHYLINSLPNIQEIERYSNILRKSGTYVFGRTRYLSNRERSGSLTPAYPDLELPAHPFWNSQLASTEEWGIIFTDPDFYMYNAGIDGNEEAVELEETDGDSSRTFNRFIAQQIEWSIDSVNQLGNPDYMGTFDVDHSQNNNQFSNNSAHISFDYPYGGLWKPTTRETDGQGVASITGLDGSDETGKLINSRVSLRGLDPGVLNANLLDTPEGNIDEDLRENYSADNDMALGTHVQYSAADINTEDWIDFTTIAPLFGQNPDLYHTPPDFDELFIGPNNYWKAFNDRSPQEIINTLGNRLDISYNGISTLDPMFNFNVEGTRTQSSADIFVSGNAGYSDVGQWSNTRIALYGKVKEALKGIGSKKYAARRAFPTFKIYLIEEDDIETEWIQYDDLYAYDQVQSIRVSDSRKRSASTCQISFLNVGGLLDGNNMWNAAQRQPETPTDDDRRYLNAPAPEGSRSNIGSALEQNVNSFVLQEGTKIKVKMGYSNHPDRLEDVFLGKVVEVQYGEEGTTIDVTAQSFGVELVARLKGTTTDEASKTYPNTFSLLAHMMFEPEVLHFGRFKRNSTPIALENQSIRTNEVIHRNSFGRTPIRSFILDTVFAVQNYFTDYTDNYGRRYRSMFFNIDDKLKAMLTNSSRQTKVMPLEGPQDDNIFVPNPSRDYIYKWYQFGRFRDAEVDQEIMEGQYAERMERLANQPGVVIIEKYKQKELNFNVFYSTIWDIFTEMTLRHPGFVKHPRIYGNSTRMTMFFGLPDQRYWASEPTVKQANRAESLFATMLEQQSSNSGRVSPDTFSKFMGTVATRFKPFRNWHNINSVTDIVQNSMIANAHGFYTAVTIQYMAGSSLSRIDDAIDEMSDLNNAGVTLNPTGFLRFADSNVVEMKAHKDLSMENIRTMNHQFANARGPVFARRYARSLLANYGKEMYKGSVLILGNPNIKPYDVVILNDHYNDISGPIEVEEVVHMFSAQTGFLTEIIPDTFIIQEDISPVIIWNGCRPVSYMKTDLYLANNLFTSKSRQELVRSGQVQYSRILDRYAGDTIRANEQVNHALDLLTDLRNNSFYAGGALLVGGTVAGLTVAGSGVGVVSAATGAAAVFGGLAIMALGQHFIVNYLSNQKVYIMLPLLKRKQPWLGGFELNYTNAYYQSLYDRIRKWMRDGSEGLQMWQIDALTHNHRLSVVYGKEFTAYNRMRNTLAGTGFSIRRSLDRAFNDALERLIPGEPRNVR